MDFSKVYEKVAAVYFIALSTLMHYFIEHTLYIGIGITHRHLFALAIIVSAGICFLVKPNVARGSVVVKSCALLSIPTMIMFTVSLLVWFVERSDVDIIMRGISYYFIFMNNMSAAFAAGALLYMFGEKGIWYNLIAIVISNLIMIADIIQQFGVGTFMSEFITLVKTFAGTTGDIIKKAEIHELAFCLGIYLIYMLMYPKKNMMFLILFLASGFCFVAAFKRIAVVGIALAVVLGYFFRIWATKGKPKKISNVITISLIVTMAILMAYIYIVKAGVFEQMQEAGVETSGRAQIYRNIDKYYEFSPSFMGRGMGFLTYELNENVELGVGAIHNDFLQFYIDLGFWGYILWLISLTLMRTKFFGRGGKIENEIVTFALIAYIIVSSSTDNTLNYQLFHTAIAMIMVGHGFDERVREEDMRLFGVVSDKNL